jgi:6-phosphogluconate dehydrogenase
MSELLGHLAAGDLIIDGGNSHYTDSLEHAERCGAKGLLFLDVGMSGGVWGLEVGYCLMAGGPQEAYDRVEPVLAALAPENGYALVGGNGAGHFVKMVHNGIEYAMLQGIGEGFETLAHSDFEVDLRQVAELWSHGSVVRSWLLELLGRALGEEGNDLGSIAPFPAHRAPQFSGTIRHQGRPGLPVQPGDRDCLGTDWRDHGPADASHGLSPACRA